MKKKHWFATFLLVIVGIMGYRCFAQDIYLTPLAKFNVGSKKISSLSFSPLSKFISVLNTKQEVSIWQIEKRQKVKEIISNSTIMLHQFYEEEKLLVVDKSGQLQRLSVVASEPLSTSQLSVGIRQACLDPTRQYVAAFLKENIVELFDLKANMTAGRISVKNQVKDVGYLGYDRFAQQIAIISTTGETYSWNPLNQKFLRELNLKSDEYANSSTIIRTSGSNNGADKFLLGMEEVFIPQGGFLNTSNKLERRNWIVSFDWQTGQEVRKASIKYPIDGMAVGPGPSHVAYYSTNSQAIVLLNLEKAEAVSVVSVDEKPTAISISDDNQYLAVGTISGNLYLYEIVRNNPAEIKILKPALSRNYGDQIVNEPSLNVEGYIDGKGTIAKVFINGEVIEPKDRNFAAYVNLEKGKNRIRISVQNSTSVVTEKDFYVTFQPSSATIEKTNHFPQKGKRKALVIGNSNYAFANKLIHSSTDAKEIAATLQQLGFEVTSVLEGNYESIKNSIYNFGHAIVDADISLFYYAGHGLEVDGTNYLIPIDANIESALDVKLKAIPLTGVIRTMEFANDEALNMIILDACRNNPFPTGKRGGTGLAPVQTPSGTLIAYATDPGSTASDGEGKNGLYTGVLIKQLNISQRIEDIFMNTRNEVEKISGGRQRPWEEARLKGVFYLK